MGLDVIEERWGQGKRVCSSEYWLLNTAFAEPTKGVLQAPRLLYLTATHVKRNTHAPDVLDKLRMG